METTPQNHVYLGTFAPLQICALYYRTPQISSSSAAAIFQNGRRWHAELLRAGFPTSVQIPDAPDFRLPSTSGRSVGSSSMDDDNGLSLQMEVQKIHQI